MSFDSVLKGLGKLKLDEVAIRADLNSHWEVTAEAIQTILRREAVSCGNASWRKLVFSPPWPLRIRAQIH